MLEELEQIELAEEIFGTDFPVDLALNQQRELVDHFVLQLKGWGPNRIAADFLNRLAKKHDSPELAQGLHDSWRREQVSAVIQEIFNIGDVSTDGTDDFVVPVRKPRGPKLGGRSAAQRLDDDNSLDRR
jgi:hypothetical protein